MGNECLSVHELRRRWKPAKQRLLTKTANDPTTIRLHRAFSWMARCEECAEGQDLDLQLVCRWIALNSLYGQWDSVRREPLPDRDSWRRFFDRLIGLDGSAHLSGMLKQRRELVISILDDEYLSGFFWEEPGPIRAGKSKKARFDARTWYLNDNWRMLLDRLLERIYLLRCQLVHGAATFGGTLNRGSLNRCDQMMSHIMNAVALVIIDHGPDEDWGAMCYPPLRNVGSELGNR